MVAARRLTLFLLGLMAVEVAALSLDALLPPDLSRARRASPVVLDRQGAWLRALPVESGRWRLRADLDRTDPDFLRCVVATEDKRFWVHPGFDPVALGRATAAAVATGRIDSGASTLTMQTARLLEPRPRTISAKLIEIVRAAQLEARYSKREILALYLTLAPYGGNLEGVRAASLSYFGHEPESLTAGEQALLIALPQSPEARRPDRRPKAARAGRSAVLAKLVRAGCMAPQISAEAETEPLPRRSAFPALAWHAAGELARGASPSTPTVVSTLDAGLQARLEPLAARLASEGGPDATAAILVVDVDGRAVRAAVGSAGLSTAGGWVDMTRARRSPGSTLKPFIYALAFEQGIATPDTQLDDTQHRFADYQPENFDRVFHEKVTAREALANSLNVPAVAMLARVGPEAFEGRLTAAGVVVERPKARLKEPGLAMALGGVGISLRDLAVLYAALADDGVAKPLAWTETEAASRRDERGHRLVEAKAAGQALDILRETPAPAGVAPATLMRGRPVMAYKTGTSYGFRDALAAGVIGDHVVIVWTGRADGGAQAARTGRDAALPVLFQVAEFINAPPAAPRPIAPRDAPAALVTVSAASGPSLIFPPDNAEIQVDGLGAASRGLVLAASGEDLSWYADGRPLAPDPVSGEILWRPASAGFYTITVVDVAGRATRARVRIRAAHTGETEEPGE